MKRQGWQSMTYVRNTSRIVFNGRCTDVIHIADLSPVNLCRLDGLQASERRAVPRPWPCGSLMLYSAGDDVTWTGRRPVSTAHDASLCESNVGPYCVPHRLHRRLNECIIQRCLPALTSICIIAMFNKVITGRVSSSSSSSALCCCCCCCRSSAYTSTFSRYFAMAAVLKQMSLVKSAWIVFRWLGSNSSYARKSTVSDFRSSFIYEEKNIIPYIIFFRHFCLFYSSRLFCIVWSA